MVFQHPPRMPRFFSASSTIVSVAPDASLMGMNWSLLLMSFLRGTS
jgi:hypothetical protein